MTVPGPLPPATMPPFGNWVKKSSPQSALSAGQMLPLMTLWEIVPTAPNANSTPCVPAVIPGPVIELWRMSAQEPGLRTGTPELWKFLISDWLMVADAGGPKVWPTRIAVPERGHSAIG